MLARPVCSRQQRLEISHVSLTTFAAVELGNRALLLTANEEVRHRPAKRAKRIATDDGD